MALNCVLTGIQFFHQVNRRKIFNRSTMGKNHCKSLAKQFEVFNVSVIVAKKKEGLIY